jgi:2-succinyl-5-enolpyruvyl-6-hydroxy-3-cyclohexene-1-carboxylate synthase
VLRAELIQTVWARTVIGTLATSGIVELIVSPGSRSTPLVAAAVELGVPCRSVIDERSAAFLAVGAAKVSGRPMALICTSGSAPAHYLPAVIEASRSGVPLVVVSADRPPELHGCEASQTVDQQSLLGAYCRWFVDLGVAEAASAVLRGMVRSVSQAVARSHAPQPGPVHINVPLRKPLQPVQPDSSDEVDLASAARAMVEEATLAWAPAAPKVSEEALEALAISCRRAQRGVIVLGPAPLAAVRSRAAVAELSAVTGFPVLAEATSQHRFYASAGGEGAAFELLAGVDGFDEQLLPDLVIQLGAPPTAGAWGRMLDRHPDVERWVVAPWGWPDPHSSARAVVSGDAGRLAEQLIERLRGAGPSRSDAWKRAWAEATQRAWQVVDDVVATARGDGHGLNEAVAARAVARAVPAGAVVAVSNGLPVRLLDWYVPAAAGSWGVWCQRGASGIDGIIAGVTGAALTANRPVVAVLGDVAFAHDVASLAVARQVDTPLVLVILDNHGGRVFELLPEADAVPAAELERLWLTPTRLDPVAVATAFGVRAVAAQSARGATAAVASACESSGPTVVRVQIDPSSQAQTLAEVRRRLADRWSA